MAFRVRRVVAVLAVTLACAARARAQEPVTITGKIVSDAGLPLGQVEIAIPTMGLGALSREDGSYALIVPGARVSGQTVAIIARRLGFKASSAQVTLTPGAAAHDFTLAANPLLLGEVVVTGAGTATETEKLGNVRNSVAADQITKASETNLVEALAAKAPNVTVIAQSGDPGAGSFINIRGINSILGENQPLFVVDGVPVDNSTFSTSNFNAVDDAGTGLTTASSAQAGQTEGTTASNRLIDLNPNDIESVEILKGPAASAIYGARAGAGVVLITTKAGQAGPTRFTFRSSSSFDDVNHTYPLQTWFAQGNRGVAANVTGIGVKTSLSWGPRIAAGQPVYDHANEIYQVGHTFDNGITISGGNDRTTFYLSGDNSYQNGVMVGPNDHFNRTALRLKAAHHLTENLKIGGDLAFADSRGRYVQRGNNLNGVQLGDLRSPPNFNNMPYLVNTSAGPQERSYRFPNVDATTLTADRIYDNPFWVLNEQLNSSQVGRVYGNVNAQYLPTPWLKVDYTLGADYATDERLEGCPVSSAAPCTLGRVVEGKIINYQIDHNLTATATYTVNPDVGGSVTLGQNLNTRDVRALGTVGRSLIALQPFKLSNTITQDLPIDAEQEIHDVGWFGQGSLDLWSELHLTAALRNDGSSTFGRNNLRSWFPKGSAAWEFTKLIGERPWLSFGKLRLAYGEAGVEPLPYLTSQIYTSSALFPGISQGTGASPSTGGLPGLASNIVKAASVLKPERSKEFETGVDAGLFRDRADLSLTFYNKTSADVIVLAPLAPSTGYLFQGENAATIRNRGWEASLNLRPLQQAEYGWDVGLQWGRNRSLVESVGGRTFIVIGDFVNQVAMVGQPIGAYLGIGFLRCGVSAATNVVATNSTGGTGTLASVCAGKPQGALYIAPNGFPQVDPDQRIVMDPNYDWTANLRTTFRYRKVQLSALLDVRHGGQIWNGTKGALYNYGAHLETQNRATWNPTTRTFVGNTKTFGQGGWWDGPVVGPGAGTPVAIGENWYSFSVFGGPAACPYSGVDEPCIESAGFVKLRELSVSYTVDAPWVQRTLGFSSLAVRISGRNLKTWTKYTGYDPETNLGGPISAAGGAGGVDYFNNPQTRSFAFAVTLTH